MPETAEQAALEGRGCIAEPLVDFQAVENKN